MKIVVINGSPAGVRGVTAHHVEYLRRQFSDHEFETIEVALRIRHIEREDKAFAAIVRTLAEADAVLWAYPVYVMLVSAQLKRFIELLFERGATEALRGKVTTSLSTSAHHYDHTAHDYMQAVCSDLGMRYLPGFSAGLEDLLTPAGRDDLRAFLRDFLLHVAGETPVEAPVPPVTGCPPAYEPVLPPPSPKTGGKRIVLLTDAGPHDANLQHMIEVFERSTSVPVDRLDLNAIRMDGGCLGCQRCADDGRCHYRDDYAAAFDGRVRTADAMIYAVTVRDRFLSARVKAFTDRYFSNGHRPVLAGKAIGFIVSGPLGQLATLREVIEAHIEVAHCKRLGVVTDEDPDTAATTKRLQSLARCTERWLAAPWHTPQTFRGHAAQKNFRDLVYSHRGIMSADHRYYLAHGLYDFPQRKLGWQLFNSLLLLLKRIPFLRRRMRAAMRDGQTRAYRRLLASS
jgi:multimeric flavodoxin WrbA